MPVRRQHKGNRGVTKHLRHDKRLYAFQKQKCRGGVPEIMRADVWQPCPFDEPLVLLQVHLGIAGVKRLEGAIVGLLKENGNGHDLTGVQLGGSSSLARSCCQNSSTEQYISSILTAMPPGAGAILVIRVITPRGSWRDPDGSRNNGMRSRLCCASIYCMFIYIPHGKACTPILLGLQGQLLQA